MTRDRLEQLLLDEERPIQLIVAGKSHPADDGGKALIQQVVRFADRPEVRHRIAFLPDYDMSMARLLYWGCDVWLNNPLRPLEACGTSGMKSALNGGLNLSIRDGWWDEWYDGENGWAIPSADGVADEDRRDDLEASGALRPAGRSRSRRSSTSATNTVCRRAGSRWCATPCRRSDRKCWPRAWCATTSSSYYLPAAQSLRKTVARADGADGRRRVRCGPRAGRLPSARRGGVAARSTSPTSTAPACRTRPLLGSKLTLTATVQLAGLAPDEVTVQAVVGRVDASDALLDPITVEMSYTGTAEGGNQVFSTTTPLPLAGSVGYTVRVLPHHPMLAGQQRARTGHAGLTASGRQALVGCRRAQPLQRRAHLRRHWWSARTAATRPAGSRRSGRWPSASPAPRPRRGR